MDKTVKVALAVIVLLVFNACSRSGGSPFGSQPPADGSSGSYTDYLSVVFHSPANGAMQVAVNEELAITFDSYVAIASLSNPGTSLTITGSGTNIPGNFTIAEGGRTAIFRPSAPLNKQTDYTFNLSAFTCDNNRRLLEYPLSFQFRTLDDQAPTIPAASANSSSNAADPKGSFWIDFSEQMDKGSISTATVSITDSLDQQHPVALSLTDNRLTIDPIADLLANRQYALKIKGDLNGALDLVGNPLAADWQSSFTTATDTLSPQMVKQWPPATNNLSPNVQPEVTFDESIDLDSVGPSSVFFLDNFATFVSFVAQTSADRRTVRLVPSAPLITGRTYVANFLAGAAGLTDINGNHLGGTIILAFTVGADSTAPALNGNSPVDNDSRISVHAQMTISFDEALDQDKVDTETVTLMGPEGPTLATISLENADTTVRVIPTKPLSIDTPYTLTLKGGSSGVRDGVGNFIPLDVQIGFRTVSDSSTSSVRIAPHDGSFMVATNAQIVAIFDAPMDPTSITPTTFKVTDNFGQPVAGTLSFLRGNRVARFKPDAQLAASTSYRATIVSGPLGIREATGNWLAADDTSKFMTSWASDSLAPSVSLTINQTDDVRKSNMTLPPFGFSINVAAYDPTNYALDMSTAELVFSGPGSVASSDAVWLTSEIDASSLDYRLPFNSALTPGAYTLTATVKDLAGNKGTSQPMNFVVEPPDGGSLPFERSQVVWTRFDLDRDNDGVNDFEEDLLALGLITAGNPSSTNARMNAILRAGIIGQAHKLLQRNHNGNSQGDDSVAMILTDQKPLAGIYMKIACGGLDPEGSNNRTYGQNSTGVLGRAWFDSHNSNPETNDTGTDPGLGVFPGELFLFEADIHLQVYPTYVTAFASKFLALSPHMGGTPAGQHTLDGTVLAKGFDYNSASSEEKARYNSVFTAADDWATAIGTILAHEIGHSVGLTPAGGNPQGLHGDGTLHNELASPTDVMASAVGYSSLITLNFSFRDLNLAYLRQRLILK